MKRKKGRKGKKIEESCDFGSLMVVEKRSLRLTKEKGMDKNRIFSYVDLKSCGGPSTN